MRVLIVGATELGRVLADELIRAGHDAPLLEGSPLKEAELAAALDGCDAVTTVTDDDAVNAVVAFAARRRFRVPLAAAVIANPRRADALAGLGIVVLCPTRRAAHDLRHALVRSGVETELLLGGHLALCRVVVPARLAGRRLAELDRHGELIPVAVERDAGVLMAIPELRLATGDVLHVAVSDADRITELMHA